MIPNEGPPSGDRDATIARVLDGYETLMHRLVSSHLPEFMEVGVTMSQAKVLYTVLAAGSLRMSELAARLGVSLSTTSGQVDRLVELGFLDRHDDPADRRQVVVSVTHAGETQVGRFRELNNVQLLRMLGRIDDASLALVEQGIRILADAAAPDAAGTAADTLPIATTTGPATATDRKDDSR